MTMATSNEPCPEDLHTPRAIEHLRKCNSESERLNRKSPPLEIKHGTVRTSLPPNTTNINDASNKNENSEATQMLDINSNGECFSSTSDSDSNGNATKKVFIAKIFPKRPASLPVKTLERRGSDVNHNVTEDVREKRKTFHRDVEEALSSLLWQPYEYQNKKNFSDTSSCLSYTSCSSSLSSLDLEEYPNNAPTPDAIGNAASDPHLSEEMVNNLSDVGGNRPDQWPTRQRSRDRAETVTASRLSSASTVSSSAGTARCACDVICDEFCEKMRLEVPPQEGASENPAYARSTSVNNLSSANVVGLPRPYHPRNASEPSAALFRQPYNHQRHSSHVDSNSNPVQGVHMRSASVPKSMTMQLSRPVEMPQSQQQQRMSSADSAAININDNLHRMQQQQQQTRPPLNVSNVNVNFYRAVPVNVVSAVPTIQCVNSATSNDSGGNNVSNVHIMPLNGQSISSQTVPIHAASSSVTINNVVNTTPSNSASAAFSTITTQVSVHNSQIPSYNIHTPTVANSQIQTNPISAAPKRIQVIPERTRTFTSTEAQTDDITVCSSASGVGVQSSVNKEQRRRERRERRQQRRISNVTHRHTTSNSESNNPQWNHNASGNNSNERLPDILNSHMPPPYTPPSAHHMVPSAHHVVPQPPPPGLVQPLVPSIVPSAIVGNAILPFPPPVVPGQVPLVQGAAPVPVPVTTASGFRFPFPATGFRRGRYADDPPKGCCGLLAWKPGSLRWFIVLIALVGVCCVLVGTALGAMRPAGRDHLTVSLLMIGVGIILVTVSGIAWRLTSHDSSTCRSLWGLGGSTESVDACGGPLTAAAGARRFVPRLPPSYGRPHHPYAAMMYPEFQYRPPPPSYQASMQEYRLRLLLLDRGSTPQIQAAGMGLQGAVSPPPTYRSHAGSLLRAPLSSRRDATQSEYSCPPSYRSQTSSSRPATLQSNPILHSREQSISLSESNHGDSVVNVVSIFNGTEDDIALDNLTLDSLKLEANSELNPMKLSLEGSSTDLVGKEGNLVTIVQTSDQSPVIVTVSGSSHADSRNAVQITEIPTEMEILAHL